MTTQTEIFRRLVKDGLGDPPVCLSPQASVRELVEKMEGKTASSAVVVDEARRPIGIITEQDVTRKVAFRLDPQTPVSEVMTSPVVTIQRSDYLFHAVAFMRRRGLRHIPVVSSEGSV